MSIKTKERVLKLAKLYEEEANAEIRRDEARHVFSKKQSDFDVIRQRIDVLELELEGAASATV